VRRVFAFSPLSVVMCDVSVQLLFFIDSLQEKLDPLAWMPLFLAELRT
jgi:hypothetical protein